MLPSPRSPRAKTTQLLQLCATLGALLSITLISPTRAHAASAPRVDELSPHALELGLNLRTELGAHPLRLDLGWRYKRADLVLVLDPMFWTDGLSTTDLLLSWRFDSGIQPLGGWRMATVALPTGTQLHQSLVLGVGLALPSFLNHRLQGQWGFELATMIVKHGAGLPSSTLSFGSARDYIDPINFGMFVRFDLNIGFGR